MNEFNAIEKYFRKLTMGRPEALELLDDAAALTIPEGHELLISSDTLNAGTHFLENATAKEIAHKALRVNLSDMAAMGAKPYAYQLCIAFPEKPSEQWLESFTDALLLDQKEFGVFCSGGDTTSIKGALSISITMMGTAPKGKSIKRSGGQDGDALLLSGVIGDAFLGLKALRGELDNCFNASVINAYTRPTPRLDLIELLQAHANAAIDISDGLVADLNHLCMTSKCTTDLRISDSLFSKSANKLIDTGAITAENLITGGDDYQLIIAVPQEKKHLFLDLKIPCIEIGKLKKGSGAVQILNQAGSSLNLKQTGWSHF